MALLAEGKRITFQRNKKVGWLEGRGAPGTSASSANDGTRQRDDMRRFNHELMRVAQFRFETYSPDGSICLTAVIFPFSSTNSTITSANSCTRNLSAL